MSFAAPLEYLTGDGPKAFPVVGLTWGLIAISVAVVAIIASLVLIGVIVRGRPASATVAALSGGKGGTGWIVWGVGVSTLALIASLVWTMAVIAQVNEPPLATAPLRIEVTGEQWWWRVRYLDPDPTKVFATANEIHVPVGTPVRITLIGGDVIHSFWVPALTGKTDTIPGRENATWLEAAHPGRFLGQCTEYCGVQHAHMQFTVVAEPKARFEAWRAAQLAPAAPPTTPTALAGETVFVERCGACHTVRGSEAGGVSAPDLTHLESRAMIAAGTLTNTPANLSGWIGDPQALKPGTLMPTVWLSGPQLRDVRDYLVTLR